MLTYSLLYLLAAPAPETLENAHARNDAARAQSARQAESKLVAKTKRVDTYACAEYPDGRHRFPARCARRMNKMAQMLAQVDPDPPPPADAVDAAQQLLNAASELVDAAAKRAAALPKLADAEETAKDAAGKKTKAVTDAATAKTDAEKAKTDAETAMATASADNTTDLATKAIDAKKKADAAATKVETANKLVETTTADATKTAKIVAQVKASDKAMIAATNAKTLAEAAVKDAKAAQEAETKWTEADRKASTGDAAAKAAAKAERERANEARKKAEQSLAAADKALDEAHAAAKLADAPDAPAAEAKADDKDDKTDAQKELDALKAGKLIRWGITAGVAPAFYQPLHYSSQAASVPGMGALTYVMLHPGYWRSQPEKNIYCANRWGGSKAEDAAAAAADDLAVARAKLIVERLLAADKANALTRGEVTELMCADGKCVRDERRVQELVRAANGTGAKAEAARTTLTAVVQRTTFGWRSGISASCGSRMVGMWFGYPLKYTATVPYRADLPNGDFDIRRAKLEVTPLFASGLGVSPNAYVSLLAGIALGRTNLPPGTDNDEELVVSFVFGIGGNLDLLGFLTK